MLRYIVIGFFLWHEISGECSDQQPKCPISLPKEADLSVKGNSFTFHGSYQTYYINICNMGPSSGPTSFTPTVTSANCVSTTVKPTIRADYKVTDGIGAHKVYANRLSWNKARRACHSDGGQLAIIRSDAEQAVIVQMLRDNSLEDAWLGLHDQFEEGDWVSVLDETIGEIGWAKWSPLIVPNPDNYQGKQNCARLLRDGNGMDDLSCEDARSFVCKIPT